MFGHLFSSDPFHHLRIPPAFSPTSHHPSHIPLPSHLSRGRHTRHAVPHHHHLHRHHHHYERQHRLHHNLSISSSPSPTSSSQDLTSDDAYHQLPDSDSSSRLPHAECVPHTRHHHKDDNNNDTNNYYVNNNNSNNNNVIAPFHRTSLNLAHQTFANLPVTHTSTSILILPCTLTPLRVRISTPSATHTLQATVAGDMRFHDAVRQLVQPVVPFCHVRVCVRLRGEWQEPASGCRMSEVLEQGGRYLLNERGEVEVMIEVTGGGGGGDARSGHAGGRRGFRAWGRETGRTWEIRE